MVAMASSLDTDFDAVLVDGTLVHIRPPVAGDREALLALHDRLSQRSAYFRYFSLSKGSGVWYVDGLLAPHTADLPGLVAFLANEPVGIASYERLAGGDDAEIAFLVDDEHQGLGIGTLLLEALAVDASRRGINRFIAEVLPDNAVMLNVFRAAGFAAHPRYESGAIHVEFPLTQTDALLDAIGERERTAGARSIARLLAPQSVAVIGSGGRADAASGRRFFASLRRGGYRGRLHAVGMPPLLDVPAYADIHDVPEPVDLAVVTASGAAALELATGCAQARVCNLLAAGGGFSESGDAAGVRREQELVMLARRAGMRLVGPHSLGIINTAPDVRLLATAAAAQPRPGRVGIISHSGALAFALLDEVTRRGLGVSSLVASGNAADVSVNDLLMYWEQDESTDAVVVYVERFGNPRKFARIARRIAKTKPVLVVTSSRFLPARRTSGRRPVTSAAPQDVLDALFRQAGVIRVGAVEGLFPVLQMLLTQPLPRGRRVAVAGNSGGAAALAADACAAAGLTMAELSAATKDELRAALPAGASVENPVDVLLDADAEAYRRTVQVLVGDDEVDAVLVTHASVPGGRRPGIVKAIASAGAATDKPVVASALGCRPPGGGDRGQLPIFPFPETAARALALVTRYAQWLRRAPGTLPDLPGIDTDAAHRLLAAELARRPLGGWLDRELAFRVVEHYGVPFVDSFHVRNARSAGAAARRLRQPVALKAANPELRQRADVGGIRLGLPDSRAVRAAYAEMAAELGPAMGGAVVQPMAPSGVEVAVGVVQDPLFGPLVSFGLSGIATELLGDRSYRILPLTDVDAAELLRSLRAAPLLFGYRTGAPVDVPALEDLLQRVGRLAEHLEIAELILDPVVVTAHGVVTCDARLRVAPAVPAPSEWLRRLR